MISLFREGCRVYLKKLALYLLFFKKKKLETMKKETESKNYYVQTSYQCSWSKIR